MATQPADGLPSGPATAPTTDVDRIRSPVHVLQLQYQLVIVMASRRMSLGYEGRLSRYGEPARLLAVLFTLPPFDRSSIPGSQEGVHERGQCDVPNTSLDTMTP
ncbi:hypothetical protein [Streptomyces sp. TE33382]